MKILAIALLAVACGCGAQNDNYSSTSSVDESPRQSVLAIRDSIERGEIRERLDFTVGAMVYVAIAQLKANGHPEEAKTLQREYEANFINYYSMNANKDLGDHDPLSQWLADWYDKLEDLLGPELMALLHLDDIKVVNYAVPVVLDPKHTKWDDADLEGEYSEHFVPLSGVIAYWGVWVSCSVATMGAGAYTFVCTPLAMVSENIMVKFVAPPLSDKVFERANKQ